MTLSEEHDAFAESVRGFAQARLAEGALRRAHDPGYPWDVAKLLGEQGLLGLTVPECDGGQGATLREAVIAIQEVGQICPKSADVVQAGNFGALRTFAEYATDEQKQRYLPGLLAGTTLLGLAMSESEAGSAVTDLTTSATPDGEDYLINGTKIWSTHSVEADVYLVYVRFGPGVGGIGSVLVDRGTPGLQIGSAEQYMSGEQWAELHFDNCRIPVANVLLGPGGFKNRSAASTWNVSATLPAHLPWAAWRSGPRASTCCSASSSAARWPNSRACSGNSRTWRSRWTARSCCWSVPRRMPPPGCHRRTRPRWPSWPPTAPASWPRTRPCRSWARWDTAPGPWSSTASGAPEAG